MTRLTSIGLRAALLLVVAGVLVAATGCDTGRPAAASVDGKEISADTVFGDLKAEADATKKKGADTSVTSPVGAVPDSYRAEAAASALTIRISYKLFGAALADRKLKVTTSDRDTARQNLCTDQTTGQPAADGSCAVLDRYSKAYQAFVIDYTARGAVLDNSLAAAIPNRAADALKLYDQLVKSSPDQLQAFCYVAAQVADQATAAKIVAAAKAGTAFLPAVQAQGSKAQTDGKEVCGAAAGVPQNASAATVGAVLGPYSLQDGSQIVIEKRAGRLLTYTEVKSQLLQQVDTNNQQAAAALRATALRRYRVRIDPRFGRWDPKTGRVTPPAGPKGATTTTATTLPATAGS